MLNNKRVDSQVSYLDLDTETSIKTNIRTTVTCVPMSVSGKLQLRSGLLDTEQQFINWQVKHSSSL